MPYQFRYYIGDNLQFVGNLHCEKCIGINKNGSQCRRQVCIGLPYCFSHLQSYKHLKIKASTLPDAGKGLFASETNRRPNAVVFETNAVICEYAGEIIRSNDIIKRYDYHNAPYAIRINKNRYEDAALQRGAASLANHQEYGIGNAVFRPFKRNNEFFMRLIATKPIRNGDEIFADYGQDYEFYDNSSYTTKYR